MTSVLRISRRCEGYGSIGFRVAQGTKMFENKWNILKIASLVLVLAGMAALVMTIMMGQNDAQGLLGSP